MNPQKLLIKFQLYWKTGLTKSQKLDKELKPFLKIGDFRQLKKPL
jgi:hypothetical protein